MPVVVAVRRPVLPRCRVLELVVAHRPVLTHLLLGVTLKRRGVAALLSVTVGNALRGVPALVQLPVLRLPSVHF